MTTETTTKEVLVQMDGKLFSDLVEYMKSVEDEDGERLYCRLTNRKTRYEHIDNNNSVKQVTKLWQTSIRAANILEQYCGDWSMDTLRKALFDPYDKNRIIRLPNCGKVTAQELRDRFERWEKGDPEP